jgi:hypothetical protein
VPLPGHGFLQVKAGFTGGTGVSKRKTLKPVQGDKQRELLVAERPQRTASDPYRMTRLEGGPWLVAFQHNQSDFSLRSK